MPLVRKPTAPAPVPERDTAAVLAALGSLSAEERWSAARAAARIESAAPVLAARLRVESDARVREALFSSLGHIGSAQAIEELFRFLRSDDSTLRTGAFDVLRTMVGIVHDTLPRLLADPDMDIRIISCELARALPSAEASTLLCGLLVTERDVNVCAAAIEVLAEVGGPAACPILQDCASRFADASFVTFAAKIAIDRINAQTPSARA